MLTHGAPHDDADACVLVERFKHQTKLIALTHFDDVQRRPVQHDIGALAPRIDFDAEAIELLQTRIGKRRHAAVPCWCETVSLSYSPATSLRRSNFPTGDFGMSVTKT